MDGKDVLMDDSDILRFCVGRHFVIEHIIPDIKYHLQWRQTNVPIPFLNDRTLNILK